MKKDLSQRLKEKGWSQEEIERALDTMEKTDKHPLIARLDKIVYWVALFILIFGNFLISVMLIPFLIVMSGKVLYLLITVLALTFGFLFNILIEDIEKLDTEYKIMPELFIPALAIITMYIIVSVSNHFIEILNLNRYNNPIIISSFYLVAFIFPYIINLGKDIIYNSTNTN
ncbi:hypothetical protein GOV05_02775 [Candidatus Woesearchaeota archaeon]|nr:hypothetical protein [Candidatus Woesearchaeota archaeon]